MTYLSITCTYSDAVFHVNSLDEAKRIILTTEALGKLPERATNAFVSSNTFLAV